MGTHEAAVEPAVPVITSGTGLCRAVCHKCGYVGFEPNTRACSHCGFPLILEALECEERSPAEEVVRGLGVGAPLLPGVDPRPLPPRPLARAPQRSHRVPEPGETSVVQRRRPRRSWVPRLRPVATAA